MIKKRIPHLLISTILASVMVMAIPMSAMASNEAGQTASASQSTSLNIISKGTGAAVSTITFLAGAPGATVSALYNDVDGSGDPQVLSDTDSEPVVGIKNPTSGDLRVWLAITDWTNEVVTFEYYELVATGTNSIDAVEEELSDDGLAAIVQTNYTITDGLSADLYLEITLGSVAGQSSTSTLTVLGETP